MRHTQLSKSLLLAALLPAVAGLMLGNAPLVLISGVVVIVLVRARDGAQKSASVRTLLPSRATRSQPTPAAMEAQLEQGPFVGLVHQGLPETFVVLEGSNLHLLPPGASHHFEMTMAGPKRGAYQLDPPTLELLHPLLLAPAEVLATGEPPEITIEPKVRPLRTVKGLRGPSRDRAGEDPASRGLESTEFHELRDYVRGDPLKHVNWKATAKHSTKDINLIVNEFEPEARKNVWFFLDLHRDLEVGTTLNTALEEAIDITLALVHHFTGRGHRVGGTTFNGHQPQLFYPDSGSRQELIIARALARAAPGDEREGLAEAVERSKGFLARERPMVFVITRPDVDTDGLLSGVRRIHTHTTKKRKPTPVLVLAPEPPAGSPEDAIARALKGAEARRLVQQTGTLLRVHRLQDGARGLERALARGVMAR